MEDKRYSVACERNREPILEKLQHYFAGVSHVLEIGSGTGQHAVFFAKNLPHLQWHTSDCANNHSSINAWIQEAGLTNAHPAYDLDVNQAWPQRSFDAAFTANTCHIMAWKEVQNMFVGLSKSLSLNAILIIYGPFNYEGQFTSPSNEAFHHALLTQAKHMGIRDFEALKQLAGDNGFCFESDHSMPANNHLLVFKKTTNTQITSKTV